MRPRPLSHMDLAAFVVYARSNHGICMAALYAVEHSPEPLGIRFCLN